MNKAQDVRKTFVVLSLSILFFLLHPNSVYSYGTGADDNGFINYSEVVHQKIAKEAIKVWNDKPDEAQKEFETYSSRKIDDRIDHVGQVDYEPNPVCSPVNKTVNLQEPQCQDNFIDIIKADDLISGTAEEDSVKYWHQTVEWCSIINEGINGYYEHFWNPDNPKAGGFNCGSIGGWYNYGLPFTLKTSPLNGKYFDRANGEYFDSAYRLAQYYWDQKVIPSYIGKMPDGSTRNIDKREAYYWLGRIAHLIQDMTVPAHAHNRYHDGVTNWQLKASVDFYENYAPEVIDQYKGDDNGIVNTYYRYENLIQDFDWCSVHDQCNPPALFKLFWYVAQKTQYFATATESKNVKWCEKFHRAPNVCDWVDGNDSYVLWNGDSKTFDPSLWNDTTNIQIDPAKAVVEYNLDKFADALIPHAMNATAGLYRLFWDSITIPSVPTGLVATAISSSQIDLSWEASTDEIGVVGYKVYKDGLYLKSIVTTLTGDTDLNPDAEHCYTVSSYDAAGNESAQSNESCATTEYYSISGKVGSYSCGRFIPASMVAVNLTGTSSDTTTTDSNGFYSFSGLVNGTYTIAKSGFSPKTVTISGADVTNTDFTNFYCWGEVVP